MIPNIVMTGLIYTLVMISSSSEHCSSYSIDNKVSDLTLRAIRTQILIQGRPQAELCQKFPNGNCKGYLD